MTICIAGLFQWNYLTLADPKMAMAAIVITDRMITAGDVQYEPQQTKIGQVTPHILLTIAGDYSLHSQALKKTMERFRNDNSATPESVAIFYGRTIQALKLKEAEDLYLAPLGLNSDSFLAQQKDMAPHFVTMLTDQMQGYRGEEVDALVVGSSNNLVSIYGVDTKGVVSCYNDVGFAAIGGGAWHAKSRLMQAGYTNSLTFARAIVYAFAAKKASEIAPGVGKSTDINLVLRDRVEPIRTDVSSKLNDLYWEYRARAESLGGEYIERFQEFIFKPALQVVNETPKGLPGGDAQTNEHSPPPAAETARKEETGAA